MANLMFNTILFLATLATVNSYYTELDYINVNCGDTIYVTSAKRLRLESYMLSGMPNECPVTFTALDSFHTDIIIQMSFISVDLSCEYGSIDIYDHKDTTIYSPIGHVCGYKPSNVYKSSGESLVVKFNKVEGLGYYTGSFELLITEVNNGLCDGDEFKCDNFECISDLLTCDGYDNCGDDSDEFTCFWSITVITAVSVSVSVFVFIVFVITAVACRRRNRTSIIYSNGGAGMPYTNGQTVIAQPYYVLPQPQQPTQQYIQTLGVPTYQQPPAPQTQKS